MSEIVDEKPAPSEERIIIQIIEERMKEAYLDYAMSVIVGRARRSQTGAPQDPFCHARSRHAPQ